MTTGKRCRLCDDGGLDSHAPNPQAPAPQTPVPDVVPSHVPARPPLRILIVRVGAMGDVLHGLPAVAALRAALPDCFIGWAIEPRWTNLLSANGGGVRGPAMPIVDRLHPVPTSEWKRGPFSLRTLRSIAGLWRELRRERYDVCVDLQGSIRSAWIGRMAAAPRYIGPANPRERPARILYGERVAAGAASVIEQACELVSAAVGSVLQPAPVRLPLDLEAEAWAEARVAGHRGFALLAPTAGWGAKQWPVDRFRALLEALRAQGVPVLVNASSPGDPVAAEITADPAELAISTLAQLVALTRRAAVVVGGDTGPVHLAAALGRPTVALFGPTDPARNGPHFVGARVRVLRDPSSRLDHRRHTATDAGLAKIAVPGVLTAIREMMGEATGRGTG